MATCNLNITPQVAKPKMTTGEEWRQSTLGSPMTAPDLRAQTASEELQELLELESMVDPKYRGGSLESLIQGLRESSDFEERSLGSEVDPDARQLPLFTQGHEGQGFMPYHPIKGGGVYDDIKDRRKTLSQERTNPDQIEMGLPIHSDELTLTKTDGFLIRSKLKAFKGFLTRTPVLFKKDVNGLIISLSHKNFNLKETKFFDFENNKALTDRLEYTLNEILGNLRNKTKTKEAFFKLVVNYLNYKNKWIRSKNKKPIMRDLTWTFGFKHDEFYNVGKNKVNSFEMQKRVAKWFNDQLFNMWGLRIGTTIEHSPAFVTEEVANKEVNKENIAKQIAYLLNHKPHSVTGNQIMINSVNSALGNTIDKSEDVGFFYNFLGAMDPEYSSRLEFDKNHILKLIVSEEGKGKTPILQTRLQDFPMDSRMDNFGRVIALTLASLDKLSHRYGFSKKRRFDPSKIEFYEGDKVRSVVEKFHKLEMNRHSKAREEQGSKHYYTSIKEHNIDRNLGTDLSEHLTEDKMDFYVKISYGLLEEARRDLIEKINKSNLSEHDKINEKSDVDSAFFSAISLLDDLTKRN